MLVSVSPFYANNYFYFLLQYHITALLCHNKSVWVYAQYSLHDIIAASAYLGHRVIEVLILAGRRAVLVQAVKQVP